MESVSYYSSWIYFVLALVFLNLINTSNDTKNMVRNGKIAFLIIYIFAMLRYEIGYDWPSYWREATGQDNREDIEFLSDLIIKFVIWTKIPILIYIIFGTICLYSYNYVISRYSENQALSWYFYFTFPLLFFQDCSTLRQSAAMGCFFMSYALLEKKVYFKAITVLVIAALFQSSAFACFIILLLPLIKKIDFKTNILFFISSFFVGKFIEQLLLRYLEGLGLGAADRFLYYVKDNQDGFNTFQYVLYGINVFNLFFYKKLVKANKKTALYITLVNIGLCLYNLFQFESQTATRLATFFLLFEIIIIPTVKDLFVRFFNSANIANVLLFAIMFSLQIVIVIIYINAFNRGDISSPAYTPYRIWLFEL